MPNAVRALAERFAKESGAKAALFYGSILRTGDLDGVIDFYLLTDGPAPAIWPVVSYREADFEGQTLRAKIATMPIATFASAARGEGMDTTIWTRFVQPCALAWVADSGTEQAIVEAVSGAIGTASRFAAALGPTHGKPAEYWRALFRATYAAEFRVEAGGREERIISHDPERYAALLPLGWVRTGIAFAVGGEQLTPVLAPAARRSILAAWRRRQRLGKFLNIARLCKAAFTFDGAAQYAAWKIERHTGVAVPLTHWQERHPILAAPGVLWRVWRKRAA